MLSTDAKVFDDGATANRIALYGRITEELLFVVFAPGKHREEKLAPNVRVVSTGGSTKIVALLSGFLFLVNETGKRHYDVLSSQDPFALGVVGLLVSKMRKIAFQIQIHTDCFSPPFASESFRRGVESVVARIVIPFASGIRAVSERTAVGARRLTQKPVFILPLPLAPLQNGAHKRPPEYTEGVFTVLSVGRFTQEKQMHLLVEAAELTPDVRVVLLGDGPEKETLSRVIQEKGLSERVALAPWQDPASYYAYADAFALLSRYEGYGLAIMEAALHRLPIIATDVGVLGYELKDDMDALVVPPSARAIAGALIRLKDDSALRETLSASAGKKAEAVLVSDDEYLLRYQKALMACIKEQPYTAKT
ncbi:glycosyltransferase [Patescibacteria group bacterium]|nr:glycosyltransferase [Patescibacteria group bacterium]